MANKTYPLDKSGDKIKQLLNKINNLSKDDIGLDRVDNTSDEEKKLSKAQRDAINEMKLRDERLQYYGDANIVPTNKSLFTFTLLSDGSGASIRANRDINNGVITKETLVIPYKCTINGVEYPVVEIENEAFYGCSSITNVTIPSSVISIGVSAFSECSNLINVIIPDSVKSIGMDAFYSCDSLTSITIPDSVTSIGDGAFANCRNLTEITIPDGVKSIKSWVFNGCNNLTTIIIPNSANEIGEGAFANCAAELTIICAEGSCADIYAKKNGISVEYTDEVTKQYVLNNDERLKYYGDVNIIPTDASFFTFTLLSDGSGASVRANRDINNGIITEETLVIPYKCTINGVEYPVVEIEHQAFIFLKDDEVFVGAATSRTVIIPNTIKSIGVDAFWNCSNLIEIIMPDSVTKINDTAFNGCNSLKSIVIHGDTSSGSFNHCNNLQKVVFSDNVLVIGVEAFNSCKNLTEVIISNGVTNIEYGAFGGCSSLISITIPDGVTTIGDWAFNGCNNLTTIIIPNSVISIGDGAFNGCGTALTNGQFTIKCYPGSKAEEYAIENNINYELIDNPIITEISNESIFLEHNKEIRLGEIAIFSLSLPTAICSVYECNLSFKSGDTAAVLSYSPEPIIWRGDDCDSDGDFVPEANTIYEISFKNLGEHGIVARVGAI